MDLYPAIDLLDGRCVRLYQGDYGRSTVYGDDPVAQALAFQAEGAPWVHVVDLDAARTGEPRNRDVVAAIAGALDVPVQTGGGVRTAEAARALFDAGVARVVLGTAALEDPDLVRRLAAEHPVAVGQASRIFDLKLVIGLHRVSGQGQLAEGRGEGRAEAVVAPAGIAPGEDEGRWSAHAGLAMRSISIPSEPTSVTSRGIWPSACVAHERQGS